MTSTSQQIRRKRAQKVAATLRKLYPNRTGTELNYKTPWQLLVAVVLSAQCTDRRVNIVTKELFQKYHSIKDYAEANLHEFDTLISSINFHHNKAKNIIAAARLVLDEYGGTLPEMPDELEKLPGVGRKSAVVIAGNAFGNVEGIGVDTHVKRLARKLDLTDNIDPNRIEEDLKRLLPRKEWFDFHNRLIYYGREICPARPHDCAKHPLSKVYPPAATTWPKAV
jgi:endonuclease-3